MEKGIGGKRDKIYNLCVNNNTYPVGWMLLLLKEKHPKICAWEFYDIIKDRNFVKVLNSIKFTMDFRPW